MKVNKSQTIKKKKKLICGTMARLYYTICVQNTKYIISAVLLQHYSVFTLNYREETNLCNIKIIFSHCVLDTEHEAEALFTMY